MTPKPISHWEFVTGMAFLTSLVALAIDSMLPAFSDIGASYAISDQSDLQLIVAVLFLGFGFGQLVFGPLSDVWGRKPPIYLSLFIFMLGSVFSGFAESYSLFIFGRFLQGFGGAGPRIISMALIRDKYEGEAMARITSLIMTIFILVPAIAPTLGQLVLIYADWSKIFIILFCFALILWIWFYFRQQETLVKGKRRQFQWDYLFKGAFEALSYKTTFCASLVSGMIFGVFVGYLGSVQAIFSDIFAAEKQFPLYFAILALSIGSASLMNSRMVMVLGMRKLLQRSMVAVTLLSGLFLVILHFFIVGHPPLWAFMLYMMLNFFAIGFLFGNLNALAMVPLGHIAGVGAAVIGFFQSALSVSVGVAIGRYFYDDVRPLVLAFLIAGIVNIILLKIEEGQSTA